MKTLVHNPRQYKDRFGHDRHEFYVLVLDTDTDVKLNDASDYPCEKRNQYFSGDGKLPQDYKAFEDKAIAQYVDERDNPFVVPESAEVQYLKEIGIIDSKTTAKTVYELKSTDVKTREAVK